MFKKFYYFDYLKSSSRSKGRYQGQIYFLAYMLEIGARMIPCVGFDFDWIS